MRALAKKWNLPVHEKKESQEICFIQEKDYRDFLKKNIPADFFKPGEIVDLFGNIVGKHEGLINYTIGQRRGIAQDTSNKIQDTKPMYVIGYNVEENRLIVGEDKDIYKDHMNVEDVHFIQNQESRIKNQEDVQVKIRYRHPAVPCKIIIHNSKFMIQFNEPQRAITPGQSAVFYEGEEVLGGGIIQ